MLQTLYGVKVITLGPTSVTGKNKQTNPQNHHFLLLGLLTKVILSLVILYDQKYDTSRTMYQMILSNLSYMGPTDFEFVVIETWPGLVYASST